MFYTRCFTPFLLVCWPETRRLCLQHFLLLYSNAAQTIEELPSPEEQAKLDAPETQQKLGAPEKVNELEAGARTEAIE